MLDSELYDRESHDNATGGPGAGDITPAPAVPAAVFQPPQVVFQPPAAKPESAAPARPETSGQAGSAGQTRSADRTGSTDRAGSTGPAGNGDGVGDDDDGTGT